MLPSTIRKNHTFVPLRTTNFSYQNCRLFPWATGILLVGPYLVEHVQLGYGTHHWHSNSSSVCSRRHCLRDCHCMHLSDSSLLFVCLQCLFIIIICDLSHLPTDCRETAIGSSPYTHFECENIFIGYYCTEHCLWRHKCVCVAICHMPVLRWDSKDIQLFKSG